MCLLSLIQRPAKYSVPLRRLGEVAFYGFPDQRVINSKIRMNQLVAHPCHFLPWNSGILLAHLVRDLFGRLTNDLKFPQHGAAGLVIYLKRFQSIPATNSSILSMAAKMSFI
jgi:hypothetical protein